MALRRERMRLGDILIKQNVLTEEQLKQALELQKGSGKKIGEVLVDSGMITEEMIVRALQMQLGLKVVHLSGVVIPKEVRNLVSVSLLKKYQCIPFELDPYNANILHLAMADPMDMTAIDDISIVTNLQVEPYIATTREVLTAIDRCYGASETMDAARRFTRERALLRGTTEDEGETDVSDAPIVQLVRSLIEQAIRQRASDIHIEALEEKVRVRYRIDGALYEKMVYDNSLLPAIATRIKIMGGMDISEKRKPQDGRMSIEVDRQEYDIRISSIPTVHGEKLVLRLSSKLNLTFASALRSILRQDPDIIMIGEIRDRETASIAVQASITGHLVVSTMHTNNAVGTLNRMADMGVESYLIADSMVGVIAQRLVRKLCPHCRKSHMATAEEKKLLRLPPDKEKEIYEPGGCHFCNQTGYFGRIGVFEMMEVNDDMRKLISANASTEKLTEAARRTGMHTLRENAVQYVLDGVTSVEEMLRASYE